MLYDQKKLWDEIYRKRTFHPFYLKISKFAKKCIKYFPRKAEILELGCGLGRDSIFFAQKGYKVIAIDFSKTAIKMAREYAMSLKVKRVIFLNLDIGKKFKFKDASFDVVYANLSLHYFIDRITERIFNEIKRVLKPGGIFFARCKSTKDPQYKRGKMIEKDIYILDGHIRHFFSKEYFKEKLKGKLKIKKLRSERIKFKGKEWAFVEVIAEKE